MSSGLIRNILFVGTSNTIHPDLSPAVLRKECQGNVIVTRVNRQQSVADPSTRRIHSGLRGDRPNVQG